MQKAEIIIIGAGATGLMAARELTKAGKSVIILEARNRIGGRILPLSEDEFGYQAEGGAEFVHGEAPVTHTLIKEANLSYQSLSGEVWIQEDNTFTKRINGPTNDGVFLKFREELKEKLSKQKLDIPVAEFLRKNFSDEKYDELRSLIERLVIDYDAGDPERISTFSLRDEWLGGSDWIQGRIKEGYGALLQYLESECSKYKVKINLENKVTSVKIISEGAEVLCENGSEYRAKKVIVTVPLPLIEAIEFVPAVPEKIMAASKIGFGKIIKFIFKFKSAWWLDQREYDFSKMAFMLSDGKVPTWWTQFPNIGLPVLTGWIPAKPGEKLENLSQETVIEDGLTTLANVFHIEKKFLEKQLVHSKVINWPQDPYSKGAYSYPTPESEEAIQELQKPVQNTIYFAGEALYSGKDTATVEGALGSGKEIAERILSS